MARVSVFLATVLVALCSTARPALAQDTPPSGVAPAIADDEIAALFSAFCLSAFPDDQALDKVAAEQKSATDLSTEEIAAMLHQDPGHGWQVKTANGHYQITIEDPPIHACAVRRMTPSGVSGVQNYIAAVRSYARSQNAALDQVAPQRTQTQSGIDIAIYGYSLTFPGAKPPETVAVILSNYHGHAPASVAAEAAGGVGIEVRLVHQIIDQD